MKYFFLFLFGLIFSSCSIQNQSAKSGLRDGTYFYPTTSERKSIFIENTNGDSLAIFQEKNQNSQILYVPFNEMPYPAKIYKDSFDFDFITIPFKYRFSKDGIPGQISSELNASLYLGVRKDVFYLQQFKKPSGRKSLNTRHYGLSFGVFSGIGNALINNDYTRSQVKREYQGIVWNNGLSFNMAINNFTAGLAFGFDHLLDSNQQFWIYQEKPWLGLSFGLNLN